MQVRYSTILSLWSNHFGGSFDDVYCIKVDGSISLDTSTICRNRRSVINAVNTYLFLEIQKKQL